MGEVGTMKIKIMQLLFADYSHVPHDPPVMSEPFSIIVSADATRTEDQP